MTIITKTKSSTFISKKRYTCFQLFFFFCCEKQKTVMHSILYNSKANSESVLYYMFEEGEVQNSTDISLRMSVGFSALDGISDGFESWYVIDC